MSKTIDNYDLLTDNEKVERYIFINNIGTKTLQLIREGKQSIPGYLDVTDLIDVENKLNEILYQSMEVIEIIKRAKPLS